MKQEDRVHSKFKTLYFIGESIWFQTAFRCVISLYEFFVRVCSVISLCFMVYELVIAISNNVTKVAVFCSKIALSLLTLVSNYLVQLFHSIIRLKIRAISVNMFCACFCGSFNFFLVLLVKW